MKKLILLLLLISCDTSESGSRSIYWFAKFDEVGQSIMRLENQEVVCYHHQYGEAIGLQCKWK